MQLIATKTFKAGGTMFRPGERISVKNEQPFIQNKVARKLTKSEARSIIDEYVNEAKSLFEGY